MSDELNNGRDLGLKRRCAVPGCPYSAAVRYESKYCAKLHKDYEANVKRSALKRQAKTLLVNAESSEAVARATEHFHSIAVPLHRHHKESERRTAEAELKIAQEFGESFLKRKRTEEPLLLRRAHAPPQALPSLWLAPPLLPSLCLCVWRCSLFRP